MAGATPTRAELTTMLKNAVKVLDETRQFGHVNADNLLDLEDTLIQSIELGAANASDLLNAQRTLRSNLNSMITPAAARSLLDPIIRGWGKLLGVQATDPATIIRPYMSDDFITAGDTIKTRDITFPSPVAGGGNVGDGELLRLTVDSDGEPIESVFVETKTFEITEDRGSDANTGATRNREVFAVRGEDAEADEIERTGSGIDTTLQLVDARNSIVSNAGFDLLEGTEPLPTGIPSWTSSVTVDSTNYTFESAAAEIYQPQQNANDTRRSLNIKALAATLTQRLDLRRGTITPNVPMMMQLAFNRELGTGDGTLTIKLGTATASVALAAQLGWNVLRIALGSATSWLKGFNEDTLDIEISRTGGTTGSVHIDDLIAVPMTKLVEPGGGGTWWTMVGGRTPFLQGDTFSAADVFATVDSVIQHWLWRAYGLWLPSAAVPTITDP